MRQGLNKKMGNAHEAFLADLLGYRQTRGSGNQIHDQMDVKGSHYHDSIAFAIDGKSTLGQSIGVSRSMWYKAVEQAGSERPALALRWYNNEQLEVDTDLVVIEAEDFLEMLEKANTYDAIINQKGLFCE